MCVSKLAEHVNILYVDLDYKFAFEKVKGIKIYPPKYSRLVKIKVPDSTYPTLSAMMQPFFDVEEPQKHFSVSWVKPRL